MFARIGLNTKVGLNIKAPSQSLRNLSSITYFKNGQKLNSELEDKLYYYNNKKYNLIIKDKPDFKDYEFIHDNCLNMHPGNLTNMVKSFPELRQSKRIFINDLNMVSEPEFKKLKFDHSLIIDYDNCVLANCDNSLNRLFNNYAINDNNHQYGGNGFYYPIAHPHVAEFADLF